MSDYRLARLEADVRNLTIAVRDLTSRVGALQSLIATDLPTQIRTQISNAIAGVLKESALMRSLLEALEQKVEQWERQSRPSAS
jgi:hypothetical protein